MGVDHVVVGVDHVLVWHYACMHACSVIACICDIKLT